MLVEKDFKQYYDAYRKREIPRHKVILTQGFWLAETTCTQALWRVVMGDDPSNFKGDELPVEQVSWEPVQAFIAKLNGIEPGPILRLPSEAEWEYACRAGTETPFWFGENITPEQVNYHGESPYADGERGEYRGKTVEVKGLPCNGWGLYQMRGNVWEWCQDWFGDYPAEAVTNPTGPDEGSGRVLRGGGWRYGGCIVSSAYRNADHPGIRNHGPGFRLARGQSPAGR